MRYVLIIKKILFVCVENAGRSQMAEAFFRKYTPKDFEPISAGTKPSQKVNPTVVDAMKEVGINIENHKPRTLSPQMIKDATIKVNMGCMEAESCPALFVDEIIDWSIEDPKGKHIETVRQIRDDIEKKVIELCNSLKQ